MNEGRKGQKNMRKPNIVYIFADQMRASALGCMGEEPVISPNLDQLAAEGVCFRNAVANTPVCTPSRASLITGKHALTARCIVNDLRLPEDERSIADVLNAEGYRCGYIGKWHLDGISRHMFTPPGPRRHGFDAYWAAYNCNHNYFEPKFYEDDNPQLQIVPGYDANIQTDQAIGFMEQNQDEPFCLFLSWGPPHAPYRTVPDEFLAMYPPEEVPLRPIAEGADPAAIAGYYAHVTAIDRNMGRLMDALDRLGIADDTIIAFSSDHGDMLWDHGRIKKQQPFESSINIPLIMRWPGHLPAGEMTDKLISIVDYAPTLLGLAGFPVPDEMNGVDMSAALAGNSGFEQDSIFIGEYASFDQSRQYQPWRGIRTKRYTYARWLRGGALLFDNQEDPWQVRNLAHDPAYAALRDELEAMLRGWLDKLGDDFSDGKTHIRQIGKWEEWFIREEHFYGVKW
jgi:arylsulfatase A-like enzyme